MGSLIDNTDTESELAAEGNHVWEAPGC